MFYRSGLVLKVKFIIFIVHTLWVCCLLIQPNAKPINSYVNNNNNNNNPKEKKTNIPTCTEIGWNW